MHGTRAQPYVMLWSAGPDETKDSVRKDYSKYPKRPIKNSAQENNKYFTEDDPRSFGFPDGLKVEKGMTTKLRAGFFVGDEKEGQPQWGLYEKTIKSGEDGTFVGGLRRLCRRRRVQQVSRDASLGPEVMRGPLRRKHPSRGR